MLANANVNGGKRKKMGKKYAKARTNSMKIVSKANWNRTKYGQLKASSDWKLKICIKCLRAHTDSDVLIIGAAVIDNWVYLWLRITLTLA